jgi:hypothetical protein
MSFRRFTRPSELRDVLTFHEANTLRRRRNLREWVFPLLLLPRTNLNSVEERALIHTNQFKYAVQSYMQDNTKHFKLKIEMEGKHTWQEVIECVKQADRYNEDSKGFHAKVRKVGRWTTRILPSGIDPSDPWLNLLPTDAYGCLVYGGLKVILTVSCSLISQGLELTNSRPQRVSVPFAKG